MFALSTLLDRKQLSHTTEEQNFHWLPGRETATNSGSVCNGCLGNYIGLTMGEEGFLHNGVHLKLNQSKPEKIVDCLVIAFT